VVQSFDDERLFYVKNPHRGLVDTLNCGLDIATGKYIARMDADDEMHPDRLERQVKLMEAQPGVAVCGSNVEYLRDGKCSAVGCGEWSMPLKALEMGNILFHPTVMLRSSFLEAHHLRYPPRLHAEDYAMWVEVAKRGGKLYTLPEPLLRYRTHEGQVSRAHAAVQREQGRIVQQEVRGYNLVRENLTVIIPFLNEGVNVEKTVADVAKTTGGAANIVLVNDASSDGYGYEAVSQRYGCRYLHNAKRLGVAASRDAGVAACATPYFLLLDAHMAFFGYGWAQRLVGYLQAHNGDLLSLSTRGLEADFTFKRKGKVSTGAAFQPHSKKGSWDALSIRWDYRQRPAGATLTEIACALGGGYAASAESWRRLRGLEGLVKYGHDEQYMSLKYRCAGHKIYNVNDVTAAHMYKKGHPYPHSTFDRTYNQIIIIRTLFDGAMEQELLKKCKKLNSNYDACAKAVNEAWVRRQRKYLHGVFAPNFRDELEKVYNVLKLEEIAN
jgi:glycosyltransferase involved in cell wall biosynthesis